MFYKFPSTPYIELEMDIQRSDKILRVDEVEEILCQSITIEEKIDGANLGISFDNRGNIQFQNRGSYLLQPFEGQWKILKDWASHHETEIFDILTDQYILFGEWCYAKHSVYYNALPDWFLGFDIYDTTKEQFLSVERRNILFDKMKIKRVPQLGQGCYKLQELPQFLRQSLYGYEACEGIYIRQDQGNYLKYRAKIVRKEFKQDITEHWSKRILKCNAIKWE